MIELDLLDDSYRALTFFVPLSLIIYLICSWQYRGSILQARGYAEITFHTTETAAIRAKQGGQYVHSADE